MTTYTRKCTICGDKFQYEQRAGRPPAFCSEECKAISKTTRMRLCIVCDKSHDKMNPFYCSDECRTMKPCLHCGKPAKENFCSHACLQAVHPPPYRCAVCQRPFTPTAYQLSRPNSLVRPPRYCGSGCVTTGQIAKGKPSQFVVVQASEFAHALDRWKLIGGPLPLAPNEMPWLYPHPDMHFINLPPREQNAVNFWRYVLGGDDKRGQRHHPCLDITAWDLLPEYIAYGAFTRGLMGSDTPDGIMRVWTVWPWIAEDMGVDSQAISRHLQTFKLIQRRERQRTHAKSRTALTELLQRADSVHKYWTGEGGTDDALLAAEQRWISRWLKPKREYGGNNLLYLECQLYLKAQQSQEASRWLPHLTSKQIDDIEAQHYGLNDWAFKQRERKTKELPWGPRLVAEPLEDRFQEVLNRVLTGQLKVGT